MRTSSDDAVISITMPSTIQNQQNIRNRRDRGRSPA